MASSLIGQGIGRAADFVRGVFNPSSDESPEDKEKTVGPENEQDFLAQARERFDSAVEEESKQRALALEDLLFADGNQWLSENVQQRKQSKSGPRPCLVINRTHKFVMQVANRIRQSRPGLEVLPVDDKADVETAQTQQAIIRHIERNSDASIAYGTASDYAVKCGFGFFRITTEYLDMNEVREGEESFDQEILIKAVLNPFSIHLDPAAQEFDGSDADYAFEVEEMSRARYRERFPKSEAANPEGFSAIGDNKWISKDRMRVARYWYVETKERTLCWMADGTQKFKNAFPEEYREQLERLIVKQRPVQQREVKWAIINGHEVLEKGEWAGRWIPIIRVLGEVVNTDGEMRFSGLIRHAKDPQRYLNYIVSKAAETLSMMPLSPFIAAEGQLEGRETEWQEANINAPAVLQYKASDTAGNHPIPAPQRNTYEPPLQALSAERMQAADDLKHTIGLFEPSLGAISGERSGRAIRALQEQGDTAVFHFQENLARGVRFAGRQLIDLIPKIYDRPGRVLRMLGEDDKPMLVGIGKRDGDQAALPEGVERIYEPGVGRYDVIVNMGPMFASKRQEAADALGQLVQAYPAMIPATGDLIVENMDFPGARKLAQRMAKMVPPELRDEETEPEIPPQVKQQIQQLNQIVEQLSGALDKQTEIINGKQLELEAKERLERMQIESRERLEAARLEIERMRLQSQVDLTAFKEDMAFMRKQLEMIARDESGLLGERADGYAPSAEEFQGAPV